MRRWWKPLVLVAGLVVALGLFSASRFAIWPFGPKRVRIVRSGGEPVMGAMLFLSRPGEPEPDFAARTNTSQGWLEIPPDAIRPGQEMLVIAPACGILRGQLPSGYLIELPPPLPVTLRLEEGIELPEAPVSVSLRLKPADAAHWFVLSNAVAPSDYWQRDEMARDPYPAFDLDPETRSVDVLFPCAGRWRIEWAVTVTVRRGVGVQRSGSGPSEGIPIEIPDGGGTVSFSIDPEEFASYSAR